LDALVAIRGKQQVETWQSHIAQGQIDIVVRELLTMHYDPTYFASMKRNFSHIENAQTLKAENRSMDGLTAIAKELTLAWAKHLACFIYKKAGVKLDWLEAQGPSHQRHLHF